MRKQLYPARPPHLQRPAMMYPHADTVTRVIETLHTRSCDPFSLDDMAEVAALSPFHFSRIFRGVTGTAPGAFQAALRMETAKHLLLTTDLSITDICFEVGYTSLGTFTSRFTRLVGLPPSAMRRMIAELPFPQFCRIAEDASRVAASPRGAWLHGTVHAATPLLDRRLIFIGLFPKPVPQERPIACTVVTDLGPFHVGPIRDGSYFLFAAALPYLEDLGLYATHATGLLVGMGDRPVRVRGGVVRGVDVLELRAPRLTDPPVVVALPFMLAQRLAPPAEPLAAALA
jgi:AraC family transcriptional regulator